MKNKFFTQQFILPICITGILIFCIGAVTVIYMDKGQYLFNIKITLEGINIKTNIDKR